MDDICVILVGDTDLKGDGRGTCLGVALVKYGVGIGLEDHAWCNPIILKKIVSIYPLFLHATDLKPYTK